MEEVEFFSEGGVLVTSSRIEADGNTFATRNVVGVSVESGDLGAGTLILGGCALVAFAGGSWGWGIFFAIACVAQGWRRLQFSTVMLKTSGDPSLLLRAKNADAERIRTAIVSAISMR